MYYIQFTNLRKNVVFGKSHTSLLSESYRMGISAPDVRVQMRVWMVIVFP